MRLTHRSLLYQQGLSDAIRAVGVDFICTGPNGKERVAAWTLEALLTLAEELPSTSNFEARLQPERLLQRDRGSWEIIMMFRVERYNTGWTAMVDEELPLWILPYSPSVVEHRGLPPAAAGVYGAMTGPRGAANGGGAAGSGAGGGSSTPGPSSGPGHRYPRVDQGALYHYI